MYLWRKNDGDTNEIKMEMMSTDVAGQENEFLNEFFKFLKIPGHLNIKKVFEIQTFIHTLAQNVAKMASD